MHSLRRKDSKRRRVLNLLGDHLWHHDEVLSSPSVGGHLYKKVLNALQGLGYRFETKTTLSGNLFYRLVGPPVPSVRRVRVYLTEAAAKSILDYLPDDAGCKEAREAARQVINTVRARTPSTKHRRGR